MDQSQGRPEPDDGAPGRPVPILPDGRRERLAAALRENLRRRKAKVRDKAAQGAPEKPPEKPDGGP